MRYNMRLKTSETIFLPLLLVSAGPEVQKAKLWLKNNQSVGEVNWNQAADYLKAQNKRLSHL